MDAMEKERLTKAHHSAQFLAADLRETHAKTGSVSLEILLLDMIEQAERISQRLHRLANQNSGCEFCRPTTGDPFTNRPRGDAWACPYCHTGYTGKESD